MPTIFFLILFTLLHP